MNNPKYRIKTEERNNGEKWYTPQVSFKKNWLGKQIWLNIAGLVFDIKSKTYFSYDEYRKDSMSWENIEKAEWVIEFLKLYLAEKHGNQTKTITYKEIE